MRKQSNLTWVSLGYWHVHAHARTHVHTHVRTHTECRRTPVVRSTQHTQMDAVEHVLRRKWAMSDMSHKTPLASDAIIVLLSPFSEHLHIFRSSVCFEMVLLLSQPSLLHDFSDASWTAILHQWFEIHNKLPVISHFQNWFFKISEYAENKRSCSNSRSKSHILKFYKSATRAFCDFFLSRWLK